MKAISISLMLMILSTSPALLAQTTIGFTGGVTSANVSAKYQNLSVSSSQRIGFTIGVFKDVPLGSNLNLQPALNFIQKGYKEKDENTSVKVTLNYLEIPLNLVYSTKNNRGFFIGAGPSMACGLTGKEKYVNTSNPNNNANSDIQFGPGLAEIKRLEFGANALTGYKFSNGFMLIVNYNLGLTSIQNGKASEMGTLKNKYLAIKIGYAPAARKRK